MKSKTKDHKTLMKIGGEGGSITINKKLVGNSYKYWFTTNEAALADFMDELEGIKFSSTSDAVDSFEEIFAMAKKRYPLFKLYLLSIDDEVREFVSKELKAFIAGNEAKFYGSDLWKDLLI